jgi:predicted small secreted protein
MKHLKYLILSAFLALVAFSTTSCKTAEGCGLEEKYGTKTDKNGNLSTKRGKSTLFDKKRTKKMKGR